VVARVGSPAPLISSCDNTKAFIYARVKRGGGAVRKENSKQAVASANYDQNTASWVV